ncbi:MAG TPA: hypothetical protein VGR73_14980 [Bryobacteraceae bacterium]|nr:hypothetical protein [Bryobacteraceae bacterium]
MFAVYLGMARPPLPFRVPAKDQKDLKKLLSGGVQQVRVVLRAVALLQLTQGVSEPLMPNIRIEFWSGRGDLNARPPAPKASERAQSPVGKTHILKAL